MKDSMPEAPPDRLICDWCGPVGTVGNERRHTLLCRISARLFGSGKPLEGVQPTEPWPRR